MYCCSTQIQNSQQFNIPPYSRYVDDNSDFVCREGCIIVSINATRNIGTKRQVEGTINQQGLTKTNRINPRRRDNNRIRILFLPKYEPSSVLRHEAFLRQHIHQTTDYPQKQLERHYQENMEYGGSLSFEASDRRSSRDDGMNAEEIPPVGPSNDAPHGLTRDSRGSAVASRASKKRKRLPGKAWTFEEKSIIVEGLKNGLSSKEIHEKSLLPNRTLVAIMLRATSLKNNNNDQTVQPDQLHVPVDPSNVVPQVTKVDFGSGTVTPVATKKQKQGQWTEEEKSVVNMGRMKGLSYKAIHGMLPNRSIKAIVSQAKLLVRDNHAASESATDSTNPVRPVSKRKSVDRSMEGTRQGLPENSDNEPIRPDRAGEGFQEFICKEFERPVDDKEDRDIEGSDWGAEPVQPQNLLNPSNGDPQAISAKFEGGAMTHAATKKQKQGQWTEEEKSIVNMGRLQGLSYKAIHDMLPNRSIKAIASQATLLRRDNHTASESAADAVNAGGLDSKRKSVDRSIEGKGDGLAENSDIEPIRPRRAGEVFQNFIKKELERLAYDKKGREIEGSDLGAEPVPPQKLLNPSNDAPQVRIAVFGGESVTPVAAKKRRKGQVANRWTEEEKCIVNMGCLKGLSYKAIHDMLPHRSIKAIALQATLHVGDNHATSESAADTVNAGGPVSKRESVDRSIEGKGEGLAENSDIEPVRPRRPGEVFQNFIKEELERLAYDKKGREIEGSDLGAEPVPPQKLLNPSNDAPQVRIAVFGGESVTPVAAKKQRKGKAANKWTEEEKSIVNMGRLKGLSHKAIHDMLPNRSIKAIALQATLLTKENYAENESAADTVNPVRPGSKRKAVDRSTDGRGEGLPEYSDIEPIRPRRSGEVFQQYINKELERLTAGKAGREIEGSDWVAEPVQPQILLNPFKSDPQLISAEFEGGTATHVATKKQRKGQAEKNWTEGEKSIIYMARLQGLSFRAIHEILPNRSIRAIALQATLLIQDNYTANETATDTFYPLKPVSKNKPLVRSMEGPSKSFPESSVIEPIRPSRAEVFQEIINEELERLTVDKEGRDIESSDWGAQRVPLQNCLNLSNSDAQETSADFDVGTLTSVATKQLNKVKTARNLNDQSGQLQNAVEDSKNAPQLMQANVGGNSEALKIPSPEELAQYVEETSWRYNSNSIPESVDPNNFRELLPLAPPAPLPPFPQTGDCVWTFNEQSRVLLGSFRKEGECTTVNDEDREFLFDMMERNDVTVVTEGNADELDPDIWSLEFIKKSVGAKYHHKFRRFTALSPNHPTDYQEVDGYLVMKISDYFEFLAKRENVMMKLDSGKSIDQDLTYVYLDADDQQKSLNLLNDVVYMIDYDIVKMLPEHNDDLMSKMKLPEFLPGGRKCMMNAVGESFFTFSFAILFHHS